MKNYTLLFILFLISGFINAQITVTNASWPNAGDTLHISIDNSPEYFIVPAQSTNAIWDFSVLKEDENADAVFHNASEGDNFSEFPNAELYINTNVGEVYYSKSTTKFELLGLVGDFTGLGFPTPVKYNPPNVERRSPMKYFDVNSFTYAYSITLSAEAVPDSLIPFAFDSIRFGQVVDRLDVVDSWGKVTIPGGTYDILREKRTELNTYKAELLVPFLGWIDLSSLGGGFVPAPDTSVSYFHFAEGVKEPILVLESNSTGDSIVSAQFKDNFTTGIFDPIAKVESLSTYPNPADQYVNIKMNSLPAGQYQLSLINILGQAVRTENIQNPGNAYEVYINTSLIQAGWYVISLKDKNGVTVAAGTVSISR